MRRPSVSTLGRLMVQRTSAYIQNPYMAAYSPEHLNSYPPDIMEYFPTSTSVMRENLEKSSVEYGSLSSRFSAQKNLMPPKEKYHPASKVVCIYM